MKKLASLIKNCCKNQHKIHYLEVLLALKLLALLKKTIPAAIY